MAVTFGTPVAVNNGSGSATSAAFVMSGVTSGQPIIAVLTKFNGTGLGTGCSDTFSTPYTWTQVDALANTNCSLTVYIGTGGAGTSGTVTITCSADYVSGFAVPCIGASALSGLSAIDTHSITSGTAATINSVSLTPANAVEGAIYIVSDHSNDISAGLPGSPWVNTTASYSSAHYADMATYASPPASPLSTTWTGGTSNPYVTAGLIVKVATTVPGAPTIGTATAGDTTATVNWSTPGSDGYSPITGYVITPYIGGVAQSATTVGVVTSYVVTGLTNYTAYTFKVAAMNAVGTGSQSAASNSVTPFHTYTGTGSLAGTFSGAATGIPYGGQGTGSLAGTFSGAAAALVELFPTGSLAGTFSGAAAGVLTYHATGSLAGTFSGAASPVPGSLLPPLVSAVAGYDEKTPIITITVEPNILNIFGVFGIAITLLRNDGNYVIGASPLDPLLASTDPLETLSVSIVDEAAPYGLPTAYIAEVTVLGGAISPPSIPSLPVTMGQAPDTTDLYNRMGWAQNEDTSGVLEQWLSGIGDMLQTVDNLCRDGEDTNDNPAPGWSQVLDVNRAPTWVLPWLAQFVGVRLDPSLRDDQQRYQIENPAGFARGTPAYIIAAANQYLIPGWTIVLHERDTSPYHLTIDVPQAGIAGISSYLSIWQENPTYTAIQSNYATYKAMWFIDSEIIAAIDATIPGGIIYIINFT